jgi:4-hydroxy-tetrahydrodipicolinate synthase
MSAPNEAIGASCALTTAFHADGAIDAARPVALARDVLARDCRHIAVFGTTGEGASIGLEERGALLDAPKRVIWRGSVVNRSLAF